MSLKIGDVVTFSYSGENIHDPNPIIFYLAEVDGLVHGMNINYMSPSNKRHYFYLLKIVYYGKRYPYEKYSKDESVPPNPITFYRRHIKNHLQTNCYRTYKASKMKNVRKVSQSFLDMDAPPKTTV